MLTATDRTPTPFAALTREFLAQFYTSESMAVEAHRRQALAAALAFLFAPGFALLVILFPQYNEAVIHVRFLGASPGILDDLLEWILFLFSTYSMLAVGVITVSAWDTLIFDRRDAMLLGPLPLRHRTLIGAKLTALGAFLLVTATAANVIYAFVFAVETSEQFGIVLLVRHFAAYLGATVSAAAFIFAALVALRGMVTLVAGPRLAANLGSLLQFGFVIALLSLVFLSPAVWQIRFMSARFTDWMPNAWFVGVFEWLRASPRMAQPEFVALTTRALVATPLAILSAIVVSIVGFRKQMQVALTPPASAGPLGGARLARIIASWIAGSDHAARATADFILLTIARNRAQQATIATNAAVGAAIVIAALSKSARDLASLMQPRIAVLWIPLVMAYWTTLGVRASFLMPSEVAAGWVFRINDPSHPTEYWKAARAAMLGFVLPIVLLLTFLVVGPLAGWRIAALHGIFVTAMTTLLVEAAAQTVGRVPFTRHYRPGHANLKARWPLYLIGLMLFAYVPTRIERSALTHPSAFIRIVGMLTLLIAAFEWFGRRRLRVRATSLELLAADESEDDPSSTTVLDLSGVVRGTAVLLLLASLAISGSACSPGVNLADGLKVDAASTGWLEVRRDKVVPAVKLALRNTSQERLRVLLVNARFHSADDADEWGTGFLTAAGSEGLAPGAATGTIVLKGEFGYTGLGVQRMVDQFVETKVELFAKYGAERWTRLGEFTIARQLLQ